MEWHQRPVCWTVCVEMCPSKRSVDGEKKGWNQMHQQKHHQPFFHPRSSTWNLRIRVSNKNRLCQWLIFRWTIVKLRGVHPCFLAKNAKQPPWDLSQPDDSPRECHVSESGIKGWSSRGPSQVHIRRWWASGVGTGATNWKTGWYADIAICSNLSNMGENTPGQVNDFDVSSC